MMIRIIWLIYFVVVALVSQGQKDVFRIKGDEMIMTLDDRWSKQTTDSLLTIYEMKGLSVDSAFRYHHAGKISKDGWLVRRKGKHVVEVYRSVMNLTPVSHHELSLLSEYIDHSQDSSQLTGLNGYSNQYSGFNQFRKISIIEMSDGISKFRLEGHQDAQEVLLSGSFNNWSTSGIVMQKVNNGWEGKIKLIPGRYEYKFIVDGHWMRDPENLQKMSDNYGDYNSVYFRPNATFKLERLAKRVYLCGSFNQWREKEIEMKSIGNSWFMDMYLTEGIHQYKFIVDGSWITDPTNPQKSDDGWGGSNSVISIGDPQPFFLKGYLGAQEVYLCGSFNDWKESDIAMMRSDSGWHVNISLGKSIYEYRFRIDGKWVTDPSLPLVTNEYGEFNNYTTPKSNHVFRCQTDHDAKTVFVTGSFCQWREPGFALKKVTDRAWELPFYLPSGKTRYKYIVDGEWKMDVLNPDYEQNEYGTGNSIIWVK